MPLSHQIANKILDHLTGKATWTAPAAVYVGFSSTAPTKTATNIIEPSGGSYARIQITAAQFISATASATENNTDKTFATATADWLTGTALGYITLWDHVSNSAESNFLGYTSMTVARSVLNGETMKILNGDLDLSFT